MVDSVSRLGTWDEGCVSGFPYTDCMTENLSCASGVGATSATLSVAAVGGVMR